VIDRDFMGIFMGFKDDLPGFHADSMGFNGTSMGIF
jgi:hypothetical protein